MKSQIWEVSQRIKDLKQNSQENKNFLLKQEIKNYIENYWWESLEISDAQIQTKEDIKNLFEEYILEENLETKNIEENIFSNLEEINNNQEKTKEKINNTISKTIEKYISKKEILEDLKNLTIWKKLNLLKKINWENFLYKINNSENNNPENKNLKYKKISELNKQEKIDLINKKFSNLNPKLELKILQEKRDFHQEWEENSYLHLDKNNWTVRNYYQISSNIKYLERKLQNNEYINLPSLRKIYNKLEVNYKTKKPVYLVWETWWWKTELAKKFLQDKIDSQYPENKNKSKKEKISPIVINSNEDTSSSELESTKELVTEEFIDSQWTKQTLVISKEISQWLKKWAEQWIPVILDEVNKMPQWTLWILNEYLSQVQDSWIYNWHSKVKKWFFVIMTWNEWENYLSRNELDPSIKRRIDSVQYPYLDKKDLAYFTIAQLNNFNKYENQDLENKKSQNNKFNKKIITEKNFSKSFTWFINWFSQIQKQFEQNRTKEDWEEKDFIYKIPSPDIWTIKNIIKKYNFINKNNNTENNKLNTTLEIQIFENYIKKDIYNLDSQIFLFNVFKQNWLYKNFNEIIPQDIDNLLNKSSEEKYELLQKIETFIEEEGQKMNKKINQDNKIEETTKTELALNFHDELENTWEDELFKNIEKEWEKENINNTNNQKSKEKIDLTEIDDFTEIVETEIFKHAIEKEQDIIENWETKYPDWFKENWDKIIFHKDWIEFNIEWLKWKKFQRENLKVEKQNWELPKWVYWDIWEKSKKNLTPEQKEELKDEQLFTWDAAMRESKKQWLGIPSIKQWQDLVDFMPWKDRGEKNIRLMEILDLKLSGIRDTNGTFYYQGSYGGCWSSTESNSSSARSQYFSSSYEDTYSLNKNNGFSVRCIKD